MEFEPRQVQADEELYRKVTSILNKLTPRTSQTLTQQMLGLEIDTVDRLNGVIDLIYEKAVTEAGSTLAVANLCRCLVHKKVVEEVNGAKKEITFLKSLLRKCQKEFEKEKSVEKTMGDLKKQGLSKHDLQIKMTLLQDKEKRRTLGNIHFIGELFKLKMLTERIIDDVVVKLLKGNDDECFECLCELLVIIGKDFDQVKSKPRVDQYFTQINKIIQARKTSSRVRFMMQDIVDLRDNDWVPRREDNNPETMDQNHKEAAEKEKKTQMLLLQAKQEKKYQRGPEDFGQRQTQPYQIPGQITPNLVKQPLPGQMQTPQGQPRIPNQQPFYHNQRPMRIPRPPHLNNQPMYSSPPGGPMGQMMGPPGAAPFIPGPGKPAAFMPPPVDFGQISMGGPPQYRPQQPMPGQFPPVSGHSQPPGPYGYQPSIVYPMGQPSPPVYILRAPHTAPMPGMPQYQTPNFKPRTQEKKIVQIKDPNSDKDVTQENLNRQPSGSLAGSTSGTANNITPNMSGQRSSSSTPPLTSQQQAEGNVRAQFAAQVAATLVNNTEDKPKKLKYAIQKPPSNNKAEVETTHVEEPVETKKKSIKRGKMNDAVSNVRGETKLAEKAIKTLPKDAVLVKSQSIEAIWDSELGEEVTEDVLGLKSLVSSVNATTSAHEKNCNVRVQLFTGDESQKSNASAVGDVKTELEKMKHSNPKDGAVKSQPKEAIQGSKPSEGVIGPKSNVRVEIFTADEVRKNESHKSSASAVSDVVKTEEIMTFSEEAVNQSESVKLPVPDTKSLNGLVMISQEEPGETEEVVTVENQDELEATPGSTAETPVHSNATEGEQVAEPEATAEGTGESEDLPEETVNQLASLYSIGEAVVFGGGQEASKPIYTPETVPSEILARGPSAIEAYNKALREGRTSVKRLPVMLIGQDRSGKTSLNKSLRGQRFNPNEASTIGIEKDPSHFQVTTEIWKAGQKGEETTTDAATSYEHHAAKLIASSLLEEKQSTTEDVLEPILPESPSTDSRDDVPVDNEFPTLRMGDPPTSKQHSKQEERALVHIPSEGLPNANEDSPNPSSEFVSVFSNKPTTILQDSESSDVHDSEIADALRENATSLGDEPEVPHDIASLVEKLLQEGTKGEDLDDDIYSVLWDFGGQFVYYVTHPLFLTPKAIYVLVYDLSRDPCDKADPLLMQGMFKIFEDKFCLKSNFDYLDFWMTSVSSLTSQDKHEDVHSSPKCDVLPEKLPPVFFVCSHADKPYDGEDPRTLANNIFDSLQRKAYSNHLVERVFVVNNTLSGSKLECQEVAQLRQHLLDVAKELPHMRNVIPVKWLKYEKALDNGLKWISLDNAKKIAFEGCKINDEQEFFTLLNFLHDQRIVIHFDDNPELNKFVVLDPQWLIDVFSKVITVKPYVFKERKYKELWSKLEETGILEETLLEHVWSPFFDHKETSESLIAMMEKFSLLCPWPSSDASLCKQYLVPSMLTSHPPEDINKLVSSAQLPSLFLKFESGHVPSGLFPRLLLQFFQWGRDEFWSSANPHMFLNFARFYTSGDEDCSVVLLCHSSSIEVIVHRGNSGIESAKCLESKVDVSADAHYGLFEVACACTVRRQLSLTLESMRQEFSWLRNMKYKVGVICPVCCQGGVLNYCRTHHEQDCRRGECLHFLSESELRSVKQSIICTRSAAATNNKVYVKKFAPWFGSPTEQDSQQSVVKRGAGLLPSSTDSEWDTGSDVKLATHPLCSNLKGNEGKAIALPHKVVELLSWKSTDPKEIVLHLEQSLQVDQSSLKQPGPETKKLVRYVASKAKRLDRLDVVKLLRTITPAGTTGPFLAGELDVRDIPFDQRRELTVDLSGGDEWKDVAEKLGLTPKEIRFLDNRTRNPFDAVLAHISERYYISVDDLYDVLNECGLPVLADLL